MGEHPEAGGCCAVPKTVPAPKSLPCWSCRPTASLVRPHYAFGSLRHVDDKFGGFRTQSSISFGAGWHAIKSKGTTLDLEGGLGYRRSEEQNTGVTNSEPVFVGKGAWKHQLTETTEVYDQLRRRAGLRQHFRGKRNWCSRENQQLHGAEAELHRAAQHRCARRHGGDRYPDGDQPGLQVLIVTGFLKSPWRWPGAFFMAL